MKPDTQILEQKLTECLDRCGNKEQEARCREIIRNLKNAEVPVSARKEILSLLDKAITAFKRKEQHTAAFCLERIYAISVDRTTKKEPMGFIKNIKDKLGKTEDLSQEKLIENAKTDAENSIHLVEEKLAAIYDRRTRLMNLYQEKIRQCAGLDKNDSQYQVNRQYAMTLTPLIRSLDQQINQYTQMLDKSTRYQAMLETGKANLELRKMMLDLTKAETMMGWLTEESSQVTDYLNEFDTDLEQFEKAMMPSAESVTSAEADEFDRMVDALKMADSIDVEALVEEEKEEKDPDPEDTQKGELA